MPRLLRQLLGFTLLIATVGLATCQSMLKSESSVTVNDSSSMKKGEL